MICSKHRGCSAIILHGPPASGKDAITAALSRISSTYVLFKKLKAGSGRSAGYRLTTLSRIERLRSLGLLLYANERYGNIYAIDRPSLDALLERGLIPVVHTGQLAGVRALKSYPTAWLPILLWCPRHLTEKRARERGSNDVAARLTTWDETAQDLEQRRPFDFLLRIATDLQTPDGAAETIHARCSLGPESSL